MAATAGDVITLAREMVNDEDKDRYTDESMLRWMREGITVMYTLRPDLFLGAIATLFPLPTYQTTDPLPVPEQVVPVLAEWVIYRAEYIDDEHVSSSRAQSAAQFFGARL